MKVGDIVKLMPSNPVSGSIGIVIRSPYKKYLSTDRIVEVLVQGKVQHILEKNLRLLRQK